MTANEAEPVLGAPLRHRPPIGSTVLLLIIPLGLFGLLAALVSADPSSGITSSHGTLTDEAWNVVNARNFVLLGRWSTDDWNLHLVNVPFSAIAATVFTVFGVGLVQARAISIAATVLTTIALGVGLRQRLGSGPATLAAAAYAGSILVLYYGHLAFLEPAVAWWLTAGGLLCLRARSRRSGRWGILAGVALALAIGTKPSAAFAAIGMVAGLGAAGWRSDAVRRFVIAEVLAILVAAALWYAQIGGPNWQAVLVDLRIWASEPILASPAGSIHDVITFPIRNDAFLVLSAPLLLFGGGGAAIAIARWRQLAPYPRDLAALAAGWLVIGLGLLALAPYRPNRYELPLLPALAILGAIGCSSVRVTVRAWPPRRATLAASTLALVLLTPGLIAMASWLRTSTHTEVEAQAVALSRLPPGAVVEGDLAPGIAMKADVTTVVSRATTRVNPGDLYDSRAVRWFVGRPRSAPSWAAAHPAAWAARTTEWCGHWGSESACLWRVP